MPDLVDCQHFGERCVLERPLVEARILGDARRHHDVGFGVGHKRRRPWHLRHALPSREIEHCQPEIDAPSQFPVEKVESASDGLRVARGTLLRTLCGDGRQRRFDRGEFQSFDSRTDWLGHRACKPE